jgi:uroporphyrinogen III methyltransferase/synthase
MLAGSADCIAFTSSSTVRNLAQLFDIPDLSQILRGVTVACIGDITSQTAIEFGLRPEIQPSEFTVPALVKAIVKYFSKDRE